MAPFDFVDQSVFAASFVFRGSGATTLVPVEHTDVGWDLVWSSDAMLKGGSPIVMSHEAAEIAREADVPPADFLRGSAASSSGDTARADTSASDADGHQCGVMGLRCGR